MRKLSTWIVFGLLAAGLPAHAGAPSRKITEAEAEKLVYAYLGPSGADDMMVEDDEGDPPEFFTILVNNPDTRYDHSFFVDRLTGDIQEVSVCVKDANDGLRAAQEKLWADLGMTPDDYEVVKKSRPACFY